VEEVTPPSENFVAVSLMPHIPDQLVVRRFIDIVEGYGQFYHAQAGPEMTGIVAHRINNEVAQFMTNLRKFIPGELSQIFRGIDGSEQMWVQWFHSAMISRVKYSIFVPIRFFRIAADGMAGNCCASRRGKLLCFPAGKNAVLPGKENYTLFRGGNSGIFRGKGR